MSREDHFHLYSCISQDLFSLVNTHQLGLTLCARAAIYGLRWDTAYSESMPSPRCSRALVCKRNESRGIFSFCLLVLPYILRLRRKVRFYFLTQKKQNCIQALYHKGSFPNQTAEGTTSTAPIRPIFIQKSSNPLRVGKFDVGLVVLLAQGKRFLFFLLQNSTSDLHNC